MRIFNGRLSFDKETDESFRWRKDVDGVKFQLYIFKERVPRPAPKLIEVSVFAHKELYHVLLTKVGKKSVSELSESDRSDLAKVGVEESHLQTAGASAILGAAFIADDPQRTETVRYNAPRKFKDLEFGDPYIPQSIFLGRPYPERLLFLVRWIE